MKSKLPVNVNKKVPKQKNEDRLFYLQFPPCLDSRLEAGSNWYTVHFKEHTRDLPLVCAHVWEAVWTGSEGGLHCSEGEMSMFPVISICLTVPLDIYQCYSVLRGERKMELYSMKVISPAPRTHMHTYTPSPFHHWHVRPAVERVIATPCPRLDRTHRPNCQRHRLLLAVKYWIWHHCP